MINRRKMLQGMAAAAVAAPLLPSLAQAASVKGKPKRVIFFLQNNGFHTDTCIPLGMKSSASLSGAKLPESIKPLEPYLDKINIINGLHGRHTTPTHSAYYGALGGYPGGEHRVPSAPGAAKNLQVRNNSPSSNIFSFHNLNPCSWLS